ncbi:hypothetical protein B0O99DRAFT_696427 [Bisporella sp. PMI_857]|nr:hypothetical protein B0O99DRAFT_696427 [Bisporella sp. PMI_857]
MSNTAVLPYNRQNRHRERPGSRKRRNIARNSLAYDDARRDFGNAHASTIYSLPRSETSVLLQHSFQEHCTSYKAPELEQGVCEAKKKICGGEAKVIPNAQIEMDTPQQQNERMRIFGGDGVDDDESLIKPMQQVLLDLFGDTDYGYP